MHDIKDVVLKFFTTEEMNKCKRPKGLAVSEKYKEKKIKRGAH